MELDLAERVWMVQSSASHVLSLSRYGQLSVDHHPTQGKHYESKHMFNHMLVLLLMLLSSRLS